VTAHCIAPTASRSEYTGVATEFTDGPTSPRLDRTRLACGWRSGRRDGRAAPTGGVVLLRQSHAALQ